MFRSSRSEVEVFEVRPGPGRALLGLLQQTRAALRPVDASVSNWRRARNTSI